MLYFWLPKMIPKGDTCILVIGYVLSICRHPTEIKTNMKFVKKFKSWTLIEQLVTLYNLNTAGMIF